ncbi:ATP-binding protein [Ancylothrix sp. C2]|uniref:hybrid sensor histidine kinase/response regulator n=1 Tax=Ancylothrix sp. D3o TaxID=2953691 RepID=UPI0021BAFFA3|nr:ATP-binding protein [Ancylothrix sp. D3o]MCT7949573.1 ATP-binding protein [Ancylothrix sp. D3o]
MENAKNILIVEDELIVAEDIADTLRSLGYGVVGIVSTGEKALQKISQTSPSLVLMDIMLKGDMDGIETTEKLRQQSDVPVVYLTANADDKTVQRATATEPYGYLVKPIEEKELKRTIEIALRRYQAEQKIKQQAKEAEEERHRKNRYLSMASHEFRTPLTTILMSSQLLQQYEQKLTPEKKQRHFERIQNAITSMNTMLEDILTLGRAESGKISFSPGAINVVEFCQELLEAITQSTGRNHSLNLEISGEFSGAIMDEKLLYHILTNLLGNAVKYSPEKTKIILEVVRCENEVSFCVQDQGIGIPPEDVLKLFEAFHRAQNVGEIAGTGLGLAIVKRSVDLHKGVIEVTSKVGVGTRFTVKLPFQSPLS